MHRDPGGLPEHLPLSARWLLSPSTSLGALSGGDGGRFGGTLQFRSAIELQYAVDASRRIGLVVQHVSNAELEQPNRGANTQLLTYSFAWGR